MRKLGVLACVVILMLSMTSCGSKTLEKLPTPTNFFRISSESFIENLTIDVKNPVQQETAPAFRLSTVNVKERAYAILKKMGQQTTEIPTKFSEDFYVIETDAFTIYVAPVGGMYRFQTNNGPTEPDDDAERVTDEKAIETAIAYVKDHKLRSGELAGKVTQTLSSTSHVELNVELYNTDGKNPALDKSESITVTLNKIGQVKGVTESAAMKENLGDYPLLTADQAYARFKEQRCVVYCPLKVAYDAKATELELSYRLQGETYQPVYRLVGLVQDEGKTSVQFSAYTPAVQEEYYIPYGSQSSSGSAISSAGSTTISK